MLVDFDGTITKHDTLFYYFIYTMKHKPARALAACAVAPLLAMLFIVPGFRVLVVSILLWISTAGRSPGSVVREMKTYSAHLIGRREFRENIIHRLCEHQSRGYHICVISASPAIWIREVMVAVGVTNAHVIGSRLSVLAGGLVISKRCAGMEKVHNLRGKRRFQWEYAYSDSVSDLPMLSLAKQPGLVGVSQLTYWLARRQLRRLIHIQQ